MSVCLAVVAVTAVSGCEGGPIGAPSATPPPGKAPAAFVVHPSDLPGYREQSSATINASTLATKEHDSTMVASLQREGFQRGASDQFADPGTNAPTQPFAVVISQALFFDDAGGAHQYFDDEMTRQQSVPAPQPGTKDTLLGLPSTATDQIAGLEATAPPQAGGAPPVHAYFTLVRRGRVVASVTAYGDASVATRPAFVALLARQQQLLQASPD